MSQLDEAREEFELGRDGPNVIIVGLDPSQLEGEGSHASLHAAAYAAGLARRQGSRLVAVWVCPAVALSDTFVGSRDDILHDRNVREAEVRAMVDEAAAHFGVPGASLRVCDGNPFDELTAVAEEERADAIVVGASTQRLGSLAVRLIRDGRWPVTVVP